MRQSSSSMPKVGCNDYNSNSSSLCIDGWNKSVILARKEDNNTKEEAAGWPRWETASSQSYKQNSRPADTYEDDPTTCKRGWNDSKDSYARVTSEGSDAIHHDVLDGWREFSCNIHVVDKGSLSKSAGRNRSADGNENRECDGWLGDMSKTPRHFTSPQSRKGYWNQSKGRTTSADDFTVAFKRGWKESGDGKEEKENDGDACDHVGHDGWNQTSTKIYIVDKGNLSKSASWDQTKDDNEKIENDGWPKWPGAMSKTIRQCASDKNRKGCWNQFEGRATSEDGSPMSYRRGWNKSGDGKEKRESAGNIGCEGWRQSSSNIHIADKGSFRKSASWDRAEDDNMKRGNDGWSRWPGAMSMTIGEDPNVKRENYEWSRWPGAMSKSNGKDENVKRENDGCPRWPGAMSKSIGEDGNVKRDNNGWPKWPGTMSKTIGQFSSNQNRKVSLQSQRGASVDSDLQKEPVGRNPDFVQNGYSWMERGSVMSPKCDWNKPIAWNASKGNSFDRDHRKWDPVVDQTRGSPGKQISPIVPPKAGTRKFFHGENSIRRKCKWSVASDFSGPYASMQHRSRSASMSSTNEQCSSSQNRKGGWNQSWGRITSEDGDSLKDNNGKTTDLDQSDDPWMQCSPMMSPTGDWNKSASCTKSVNGIFHSGHGEWGPGLDQKGRDPWEQVSSPELPKFGRSKLGGFTLVEGKNSVRKKNKLCAAPDFGDSETLKQLPKNSQKRLFRGRSTTSSNAWEHECNQSNDTYKKIRGGAPEYYGDPLSGRSQRGFKLRHHIGDAVGKHPDRDPEEFWGSKKPRYLGHDRSIGSFEDPWNQWDSWSHGSRNEGAEKQNFFQNDTSSDGFLRERCSHDDDLECPVKNKSREIYHDRRDFVPCFVSSVGSRRDNDVPSEDFRELDVQFCKEFHSSRQSMHGMLQNESSDTCDQNINGKLSSWIGQMDPKTCLRDSLSQSHLSSDDEGFRDDTTKSMVTIPMQNEDQKVTKSPNVLKNQQKPLVCQQNTQILRANDQTDHTSSPIQFGQNILVSPRLPSIAKSSNSNDQRVQPDSNPKVEVQNQEQQQAVLNGESCKKNGSILYTSVTQELNILPFTAHSSLQPFSSTVCVSSSDAAFANKDSSSSNLRSRFPPAIIGEKAYKTPEKIKIGSKDEILGSSPQIVKQEAKLTSVICDFSQNFIKSCHSEPVEAHANDEGNSSKYEKGDAGANGKLKLKGGMDEKGIRMFKFALAEFVKEIIKPLWKEGRLSKEAHKTLVKKVVEKVVGVLGPKTPQTQERIDLYLSYAKDKLHKLVQDYQEMFINT